MSDFYIKTGNLLTFNIFELNQNATYLLNQYCNISNSKLKVKLVSEDNVIFALRLIFEIDGIKRVENQLITLTAGVESVYYYDVPAEGVTNFDIGISGISASTTLQVFEITAEVDIIDEVLKPTGIVEVYTDKTETINIQTPELLNNAFSSICNSEIVYNIALYCENSRDVAEIISLLNSNPFIEINGVKLFATGDSTLEKRGSKSWRLAFNGYEVNNIKYDYFIKRPMVLEKIDHNKSFEYKLYAIPTNKFNANTDFMFKSESQLKLCGYDTLRIASGVSKNIIHPLNEEAVLSDNCNVILSNYIPTGEVDSAFSVVQNAGFLFRYGTKAMLIKSLKDVSFAVVRGNNIESEIVFNGTIDEFSIDSSNVEAKLISNNDRLADMKGTVLKNTEYNGWETNLTVSQALNYIKNIVNTEIVGAVNDYFDIENFTEVLEIFNFTDFSSYIYGKKVGDYFINQFAGDKIECLNYVTNTKIDSFAGLVNAEMVDNATRYMIEESFENGSLISLILSKKQREIAGQTKPIYDETGELYLYTFNTTNDVETLEKIESNVVCKRENIWSNSIKIDRLISQEKEWSQTVNLSTIINLISPIDISGISTKIINGDVYDVDGEINTPFDIGFDGSFIDRINNQTVSFKNYWQYNQLARYNIVGSSQSVMQLPDVSNIEKGHLWERDSMLYRGFVIEINGYLFYQKRKNEYSLIAEPVDVYDGHLKYTSDDLYNICKYDLTTGTETVISTTDFKIIDMINIEGVLYCSLYNIYENKSYISTINTSTGVITTIKTNNGLSLNLFYKDSLIHYVNDGKIKSQSSELVLDISDYYITGIDEQMRFFARRKTDNEAFFYDGAEFTTVKDVDNKIEHSKNGFIPIITSERVFSYFSKAIIDGIFNYRIELLDGKDISVMQAIFKIADFSNRAVSYTNLGQLKLTDYRDNFVAFEVGEEEIDNLTLTNIEKKYDSLALQTFVNSTINDAFGEPTQQGSFDGFIIRTTHNKGDLSCNFIIKTEDDKTFVKIESEGSEIDTGGSFIEASPNLTTIVELNGIRATFDIPLVNDITIEIPISNRERVEGREIIDIIVSGDNEKTLSNRYYNSNSARTILAGKRHFYVKSRKVYSLTINYIPVNLEMPFNIKLTHQLSGIYEKDFIVLQKEINYINNKVTYKIVEV